MMCGYEGYKRVLEQGRQSESRGCGNPQKKKPFVNKVKKKFFNNRNKDKNKFDKKDFKNKDFKNKKTKDHFWRRRCSWFW